ncbi:MAG TPA: hypothetical protein VEC16_00775 [Alphaproteobacteria bacterium]|nr:hypothetical protein [Alphaproteobacteria bacterium]
METIEKNSIIDKMKKDGVKEGTSLEIILNNNAVFEDGHGPAPTVDPQGFRKFWDNYDKDTDRRKDYKTSGFVQEFKENRVFLVNLWPPEFGYGETKSWYVDNDVIQNYKINK